MSGWPVFAFGLGSAAAYAVAATLKHLSAAQVPDAQDLGARSLGRFVRATVTHRLWLLGILADVVAVGLQILALNVGALSVVGPLLVSGLLIALVLRRRIGGRVSGPEVVWGAVLTAALVGFLVLAGTPASSRTEAAHRTPALVAGALGVLLAVACVVLVRRRPGRATAAALLGVAVGTVDAATAALLKSLTGLAAGGLVALVSSWQLYLLVALGALALVLSQLAFQAGPLSASLPAISSVDPLLTVAIGILVFHEQIRHSPPAVVGLVLLLVVMGVSIVGLTRSPPLDPDGVRPSS